MQYSGDRMSVGASRTVCACVHVGAYGCICVHFGAHRYYPISAIRAPHDQPITPRRPHASYSTNWRVKRVKIGPGWSVGSQRFPNTTDFVFFQRSQGGGSRGAEYTHLSPFMDEYDWGGRVCAIYRRLYECGGDNDHVCMSFCGLFSPKNTQKHHSQQPTGKTKMLPPT